MDQIANSENGRDRRDPNRYLVPEESDRTLKPYRTDNHVYPYYPQQEEQVGFDFYRYLRIAIKYRWLIAGTTVTFVIIAAIITLLKTPIYQATASIQIDREPINIVQVGVLQNENWESGQEFYQTQYELLASRSLAERVATTLGLVDNQQFNQRSRPSLFAMVKDLVFGAVDTFRKRPDIAKAPASDGVSTEISGRLQHAVDRLK